jgi:hypothetical protein
MQIDSSALSAWRKCKFYFQKYYVEGLRPEFGGISVAADRGTLFHSLLEAYYKNTTIPECNDEPLFSIFQQYCENFPKESDSFRVVSVEDRLLSPILDRVSLVGNIDLIGFDEIIGEHILIDHKTSSGMQYIQRRTSTDQMTAYIYLCQQRGDLNISRGMINGIVLRPDVPLDKRFDRFSFSRSSQQLDRWLEGTRRDCEDILNYLDNNLLCTQNLSDSCYAYNNQCYLNLVCTADSDALASEYLKSYKQDSWKNFSIEWEK